jgi:CHAD domain-containing protein
MEAIQRKLKLAPGPTRREDRVLMDTFDGRLRAAGLRAERSRGQLRLIDPGAPVRAASVPDTALRLGDLPDGTLHERLAGVIEERALLPLARVRSTVQALAVLNADQKTVVRLEVEHARVGRTELPPRLRVTPVLGYDRAFERTVKALALPPAATLFDEAVTAAGGRPAGVSSKVGLKLARGLRADAAAGAVLARLADIAEANVAGTIDDVDTEFLHDLRVAVRRARSVLRELEGVFPPAEWERARTELRWVQAMTGPVRDLDVQLHEWTGGEELRPLHDLLAARRAKELKALRRGLKGDRFADALVAWRALATLRPAARDDAERPQAAQSIDRVAGARIRKVYARMVADGRAIDDGSPDEALHDLRKRGKELRYLLELFGGLFGDDVVKPMVSALKGLQDVLGRFQDRAVQAEQLRSLGPELAAAEGGPDALMAMGRAMDALTKDQWAARADFAARFDVFAAKAQRRLVKDTF